MWLAIKLFFSKNIWSFLWGLLKFLFKKTTLLVIVGLVAGYFIGQWYENNQKQSEIKRLDKIIVAKNDTLKVSYEQISRLSFETDSLEKDIVLSYDIIRQKDLFIQSQTNSIKGLKMRFSQCQQGFKEAIELGHITCDTIFVKPINIFEKGVYQVIPKVKIKRLVQ